MGVSGCGKTTIGKLLATEMKIPFFDGDDFHPKANIIKMKNGFSLNDEDRLPWLKKLAKNISLWNNKGDAVLACSALKESYRKILSSSTANIQWVFLNGSFEIINKRLKTRLNHYMKASLLLSQFEDLQVPDYGIHINIENSPEYMVNQIKENIESMRKSAVGVLGLGVMGKSLSLNIASKGFNISVYNRSDFGEDAVVSEFIHKNKTCQNIFGFIDLEKFVNSLKTPRKIVIMITSGKAVDEVIEQLLPLISKDDVILDGGNSHYLETARRYQFLNNLGIHFIGCGISGGEEGALKGPSLMPGGSEEGYNQFSHILESISAKDKNNQPCCNFLGNEGSGHFVKMVHNGIEYGEMQLLSEVYALLKRSMNNSEIAAVLSKWKSTDLSSYLLEITINILKRKRGNEYVLDAILDVAANKGTGSWSSIAALNLGSVNTMMTSAVFSRYLSSFKEKRASLSALISNTVNPLIPIDINALEKAYRFARIINHHQGFELIRLASNEYKWDLNLSEIARIWTNGCIIRSDFMEKLVSIYKTNDNCLDDEQSRNILLESESSISECISYSLKNRVAFDSFYTAYNYWVAMTTENLPANLIQAQRDYFGAHTFQWKNDYSNKQHHINWLKND
jgi:6-phosphogluconate dehydrogenase